MGKRPRWYLWVLARIWKLSYLKPSFPLLGKLVVKIRSRAMKPGNFNISYLPVNAEVETVNTPLPVMILEKVIKDSSYRTIIHRCTCREAIGCSNYDMNIGCLHIGEATREEDYTVATHVSIEEALAHMQRAVDAGLVPFIGHAAGDNTIWNVPADQPFITVCFCCPCCCTILYGYKYLPQEVQANYYCLQGISIALDNNKCEGCGECVKNCFTGAISLSQGKAEYDSSLCKGCGLCAKVCPQGAFQVEVEDLEAATNELYSRLSAEVGGIKPFTS